MEPVYKSERSKRMTKTVGKQKSFKDGLTALLEKQQGKKVKKCLRVVNE